jgi:hypothetical protein
MNAASMNGLPRAARGGLSVLSLQFEVVGDSPDWPAVRVLVDGLDLFGAVAPAGEASTRRRYSALVHLSCLKTTDGGWRFTAAHAGRPGAASSLP